MNDEPKDTIDLVEELKIIRSEIDNLVDKKKMIEALLPPLFVYQNEDGGWTRFTKVDNVTAMLAGLDVFRSSIFSRFTTKVEILKHEPKPPKTTTNE